MKYKLCSVLFFPSSAFPFSLFWTGYLLSRFALRLFWHRHPSHVLTSQFWLSVVSSLICRKPSPYLFSFDAGLKIIVLWIWLACSFSLFFCLFFVCFVYILLCDSVVCPHLSICHNLKEHPTDFTWKIKLQSMSCVAVEELKGPVSI